MDKREAHFIGGPRDGQSMFLRNDHDYHDVALMPKFSAPLYIEENPDQFATVEKFTYRRIRIGISTWVFIPLKWFDQHTDHDLEVYVMDYLVRGYIGNNQ